MIPCWWEFVLASYADLSSTTKSSNFQPISAEILTLDAMGNVRSGCSGTFQLGPGSELKLPMSSLVFVFWFAYNVSMCPGQDFYSGASSSYLVITSGKQSPFLVAKNFLNNVSASFTSRSVTVTGHPRTSLSPTPQTYHYTIRNRVRVAIRQMINLFNFIFTHAACATAKYRSHRVSNARGGKLSSTATSLDNTLSPCQGPPFKLKGGVGLRDREV